VTVSNEKKTELRRDWNKSDLTKMNKILREPEWRNEVRNASVEEGWRIFKEKIEKATEECEPVCRKRNINRPPWMTQEIIRAIRKKKRLWARDKVRENKDKYKQQEKITRNLIRNAKRRFEKKLADGGGRNKRPFYAYRM
jgi:hypothetical protein